MIKQIIATLGGLKLKTKAFIASLLALLSIGGASFGALHNPSRTVVVTSTFTTGTVKTVLLPDADLGADVGSESLRFGTGYFNTTSVSYIVSPTSTNLVLLPGDAKITQIGDAGTSNAGLTANDDLYVSGKLEVDGVVYIGTSMIFPNSTLLNIGSAAPFNLSFNTAQSNNMTIMSLGAGTARTLLVAELGDGGTNFQAPTALNPTFRLQSSDQTSINDYISFSHDQTDAVIDVGSGGLLLDSYLVQSIVATNTASYVITATAQKMIICNDYSITGASTTTLPALSTVSTGTTFTVKDCGDNASANAFVIIPSGTDKIDGNASTTPYAYSTDSQSATFVKASTTEWIIL